MSPHRKYYLFLLLLCGFTTQANIKLPLVIGSNMVLQTGKGVRIWGKAYPGEKIEVRFKGQALQTIAAADSSWFVTLKPLSASFEPAVMTINSITLNNILVGEVWLCSGQSNMEFTMTKSSKYAHAKHGEGLDSAALSNEKNTSIRLFLVKRDLNKPGDINKGWNEASGPSLGAFSAAGYHFAKKLSQELKVPIGMIASSISGSNIEPWMSGKPSGDNSFQVDESKPGQFYSGMIKPLAPFTLKGFLWYQGETNCFLKETTSYSQKFIHLIQSWRNTWNDASLSFYFVGIAPFNYSKSKDHSTITETTLPEFREAQNAALKLPNTAMIVTTDLVDNLEDIHPTYKWEIGRRLALLALKNAYRKNIIAAGPEMKRAQVKGKQIEIQFANIGSTLKTNDGLPPHDFQVGDENGNFVHAEATLEKDKIIVRSPMEKPVYVRFAWTESSQPNLFNSEGLPAMPFRTDHFNPASK